VHQELDPQLAGVVLDDEQHLVVHGGYRSLRREQLVQVQVVAVRPALVELDVDAGLKLATILAHCRSLCWFQASH
jgi:hypothetical protein